MSFLNIDLEKLAVYDIETLINFTLLSFYNIKTKNFVEFPLFDDIEQLHKLYKFLLYLRRENFTLIGFNNVNFDAQVVEFIISKYDHWVFEEIPISEVVSEIYEFAQKIINLPDEEKFEKLVPERKFNIRQIDLFKQKHFDGKNRSSSLKWCEFSMRFWNVEDMPISHDTYLTRDQTLTIRSYCKNDILATATFFEKNIYETTLRVDISEKYQMNLLNASEPRLSKQIFAKFLCEDMAINYGELRNLKTFRNEIDLGEIIFPYVKFQSPELQKVLYIFENAITYPLGNEDNVSYVFKDPKIVLGKNPKKPKAKSKKFEHFFEYAGIPTDVGLGGIHACCDSGIYQNSEDYIIHDIDVVSFYPNLAIKNNVKPEHLGDSFSKIYEQIFEERKKIPKKDPVNYVYKIILNSTYGLSKEINSYLYDPKFTYTITINGQLSLLMLVEMLYSRIPNLKLYQENTDGITIGYHKQYKEQVEKICDEWCEITKLTVEYAFYKLMIILDVNNYIAVDTKGNVKKKGSFDTWDGLHNPDIKVEYNKNPSMLIVPKALEAYYVKGVDYKEFIKSHKDIYDFLLGVKKKKDFELNLVKLETKMLEITEDINEDETEDEQETKPVCISEINYYAQQKVTRFYAAKRGGRLIKKFHGGKKGQGNVVVLKDSLVETLNKIVDEELPKHFENINYDFYIKETEKIIQAIEPPAKKQLTLW